MSKQNKINIYGARAFTSKYMPLINQNNPAHYDSDRFMIVRIEEMFPHVSEHVPPTRSLNDVILLVTGGEAHMKIGNKSYIAIKHSALYIRSGEIFSFEKYEKSKFTSGFLITFSSDIIRIGLNGSQAIQKLSFLNFSDHPFINLKNESFRFSVDLLERILKENNEYGLTRLEIIRSYFIAFLLEIRNTPFTNENIRESVTIKLVKDFIEMVMLYAIEKKYVSEYALLLNISPNYLSKLVQKFTTKSPKKWIDETLILKAKVLLFQTDMNINEISTSLGIFDASYFSRLFKKYEGKSPLSFRNETKGVKY